MTSGLITAINTMVVCFLVFEFSLHDDVMKNVASAPFVCSVPLFC